MKNQYKIFQFTSRNTGYYFMQDISLMRARDYAKHFPHIRIDGLNGFFEEFENGELVSWSTAGHTNKNYSLLTCLDNLRD